MQCTALELIATLSIQAYSSTGTWQKETVLNLHLGKISVIVMYSLFTISTRGSGSL